MSTNQKNKQKRTRITLFILLVLLPWFLIIGYTLTVAKPRYVSTATVVIKQVGQESANVSGLTALFAGVSTSKEDALYLTNYIQSKDMIDKLDKKFDFQKNYRPDGKDFIYELPKNATSEEIQKYFKKRVGVSLDEISQVLTITTEGFSAEYALALNRAILAESEQFVNQISKNLASEQMAFSENRLALAEKMLNDGKQKLTDYQNTNEIFDPQTNAQVVNQVIAGLQGQLASLRAEERQLLSYLNADTPQIIAIQSQISAIDKQISAEKAKLTSPADDKLNAKMTEFESLRAEVEFANEMYKISLTSLEKARSDAIRKMKNLIIISSPHKAEEALYPRQAYVILTSLALLLIFYGFVMLILAVIKDHSK